MVYHQSVLKLPADQVNVLRARYARRRVCVTGGAGFIGGHLCDTLCSLGADITVIDDLSNSTTVHLAELIDLEPDRVRFVHGSILDDSALRDAVDDTDVVFHLAAIGSIQRSIENPERTWQVNATGTLRVLEAAHATGASRVVLAASSSAYGDPAELPCRESMPARPLSPYASSKTAAEHLIRAWARSYGISTIALRYFNIFGPRQPADSAYAAVIAAFVKSALAGEPAVIFGDGEQSRDFTFVANAVLATLLAGTNPNQLAGEVCNVGAGVAVTVNDLAQRVANIAGVQHRPEHRPDRRGEVRHSLADLTLARELIGYQPVATLDDGLEQTIKWAGAVPAQASR